MKKSIIRNTHLFINFHTRIYLIPKSEIKNNVKTFLGDIYFSIKLKILFITIEVRYFNN